MDFLSTQITLRNIMKIKYIFNQKYLDKLTKAKTEKEFDDLLSWPDGNLIFEDGIKTTSEYEINPDIFYWWLDHVTDQFEHKVTNEYEEDIFGLMLYVHWKNDSLTIYSWKTDDKKSIFEARVSKKDILQAFINLAKEVQGAVEKINPLVLKQPIWNNYYFVNHYKK